jgi:hypothetical protein
MAGLLGQPRHRVLGRSFGCRHPKVAGEPRADRAQQQGQRQGRNRYLPSDAALRPRARRWCAGFGAHAVDADRLRNVLDLLLAEKIEPEEKLAFDGVVDGGGNADAACLGKRLHARGDVDAIPIDRTVGLLDHIAQVDPNAELHASFWFEFDVVPFQRFLDFDSGLDRLDRTRELSQQRIAGRVDHTSAAAHH